jgi:two-component system, OmpR family, phosphate regulon sensor histidine kinase PhoR
MGSKRQLVTIILMISSMALLILLQCFWIFNAYEKAYDRLARDTNLLFSTTVMSIRNLTWEKTIASLAGDSLNHISIHTSDSLTKPGLGHDDFERRKKISVVIANGSEGISGSFRRHQRDSMIQTPEQTRFMLRIPTDTLNKDTLSMQFARALKQADINADFILQYSRENPRNTFPRQESPSQVIIDNDREIIFRRNDPIISSPTFSSDTIHASFRTSPFDEYSVKLYDIRPILLQQIAPQLAFSLFLTFMIGGAFLMMYHNLRSQQRLMNSKNEFIGNISHELKTPMATVSVALESLKSFHGMSDPKVTHEYLSIAQAELARLALMTDKILKTALFDDKGVEYEPEPVDLDAIITQVIGSMKLVLEKQKGTISYSKLGNHFIVSGSTNHLTNVIYNLLDNALKYSLTEPRVEIQLSSLQEKIVLTVTDNGMGIEPAYHEKIFEKFFRVPTGDIHNIKGYGLGLNYVASVIKRHHGSIQVKSALHKGSSFAITLPGPKNPVS